MTSLCFILFGLTPLYCGLFNRIFKSAKSLKIHHGQSAAQGKILLLKICKLFGLQKTLSPNFEFEEFLVGSGFFFALFDCAEFDSLCVWPWNNSLPELIKNIREMELWVGQIIEIQRMSETVGGYWAGHCLTIWWHITPVIFPYCVYSTINIGLVFEEDW